ncbi:transposase [Stenotrophomonas sp. PS02298]|uniref:REP-associated tyrosine transposase n=1 Tax=Stenotrophomonas sp. PS02298 TaxID=2991424 RepID=UPI00249B6925|nr:transposase [Stenotrophomonas sp. PS02298]
MVNYRRNRVAGGTYFFTVTLQDRCSDLLVREIDALKQAWRNAAQRVPHLVLAAAVLPEHLHAVIQMDASTDNYPRLWQEIKKGFTRRVFAPGHQSPWQARYWERTIRDASQLQACVDYVHINPLKHGWVTAVRDWPHSTFHRYVREGLLSEDWACSESVAGTSLGEPLR